MNKRVKPLYRKVNTKARNHRHSTGSDAKYDRRTKIGINKNMSKGERRGLDYTPLYRFLLKNVGNDWDSVFSEANSRVDDNSHIYWMVYVDKDGFHDHPYCNEPRDIIRTGESSYFNGLYVDENNILQIVDPTITLNNLYPSCWCCTHTFNGKPFTNKWSVETMGYGILKKKEDDKK